MKLKKTAKLDKFSLSPRPPRRSTVRKPSLVFFAHSHDPQLSNAASYAKIGPREVLALVDIGTPIIEKLLVFHTLRSILRLYNWGAYVDKCEYFPLPDLCI